MSQRFSDADEAVLGVESDVLLVNALAKPVYQRNVRRAAGSGVLMTQRQRHGRSMQAKA
jgi:hypothetical protein